MKKHRNIRKILAWVLAFSLLPASVLAEDILSSGTAEDYTNGWEADGVPGEESISELDSAYGPDAASDTQDALLPVLGALEGLPEDTADAAEAVKEGAAAPEDESALLLPDGETLPEDAPDVEADPYCGEKVQYHLSSGILQIYGTGPMNDFSVYGAPWFSKRSQIKNVIIEEGVTTIPTGAFSYRYDDTDEVKNLVSVSIPTTVTKIGDSAFAGCIRLNSVVIPGNLESIEAMTFYDCKSLKSVTILGNKLKTITSGCFAGCSSLESVTLPDSVETIADASFAGCSSLKSFTFPANVKLIRRNAFARCTSLKTVVFNSKLQRIMPWGFYNCTSLTAASLPDSVTQLDSAVFANCSSLSSVKLPAKLKTVSPNLFYGCKKLTSLTIPDTVTQIEYMAFCNCTTLQNLTIPSGVGTIGVAAFYSCKGLKTIRFTGDAPGLKSLAGNEDFDFDYPDPEMPIPSGLKPATTAIFNNSVTADGYYPGAKSSWTEAVRASYKGKVNWIADKKPSAPMYRLYNPYSGEHFYTSNPEEKAGLVKLGWKDEGIGWHAPLSGSVTVYRLYNPKKGYEEHHYTSDQNEINALKRQGWNLDGPAWKSDDDKEVPLYRLFNPKAPTSASSHHYTKDQNERNVLVSQGWKNEGIGWYGVNP